MEVITKNILIQLMEKVPWSPLATNFAPASKAESTPTFFSKVNLKTYASLGKGSLEASSHDCPLSYAAFGHADPTLLQSTCDQAM